VDCGRRSHVSPNPAIPINITALAKYRLRMPADSATGPANSMASTCETASSDIRLLVTRPSIACGVSYCSSVCEVTILKAAKKPRPSMPSPVAISPLNAAVTSTAVPMPASP